MMWRRKKFSKILPRTIGGVNLILENRFSLQIFEFSNLELKFYWNKNVNIEIKKKIQL